MADNTIRHKSINQLSERMGLEKPSHPLITVVDLSQVKYDFDEDAIGQKFVSDLYCIGLKDGNCGLEYGRNHYDFDSGVLIFTAPEQVITVTQTHEPGEIQGWMLYFHPDLIRNLPLGSKIDNYTFFSYEVHEALHLSEQEQTTVTNCIEMIKTEINERIDNHSQQVLVSNIELLLNYSSRYYERQFNTRSAQNDDTVSKFEKELKEYYRKNLILEIGQPTIQYLAEKCHLSASYLSDLLKKETGRTAKDHINLFLVDKAKNLLLSTNDSISGIAYSLGFNYPHYFSRLFKRHTGTTPNDYRQLN